MVDSVWQEADAVAVGVDGVVGEEEEFVDVGVGVGFNYFQRV
jgi:hypothetical protein